ncbi:unnamed protein product, partial [Symbiodinium necroappetens]
WQEAEGAHRGAEAGDQGGLRPLRHRRLRRNRLQGAQGGHACPGVRTEERGNPEDDLRRG